LDEKKLTPMMQQYLSIKSKYEDAVLLFRLGDFYEAFFDDAKKIAKVLQLVLTHRNGNEMAGIPHHALDNYLKKLVEAGLKIAICDQVEDPSEAKGIVRREVTRVVTPGTVVEDSMLVESQNSYLASVSKANEFYCVLLDITTGYSMIFKKNDWKEVEDIIRKFDIVQLLFPENFQFRENINVLKTYLKGLYTESLPGWYYNNDEAVSQMKRVFNVKDLSFLELSDEACAVFGATLKYLDFQHMDAFEHLSRPVFMDTSNRMILDNITVENLELISKRGDKSAYSLFDVINNTSTSLGSRKLKDWLLSPLRDESEIKERLDHVRIFFDNPFLSEEIGEYLNEVYDIERIISRLSYKKITPADFVSLKTTLKKIPQIIDSLSNEPVFSDIITDLDPIDELVSLLEAALKEEPDNQIGLGKTINDGYSERLDEYRELLYGSGRKLKELEEYERNRTGISGLKIRKNKIFGYYIEVSKAQTAKIPDDYIRKQTLVSSERYISDALKPIEEKLNNAAEMVDSIERELFRQLVEETVRFIPQLKLNAVSLACLDAFLSLAKTARENNYCEPEFNDDGIFFIKEGRHPLVEWSFSRSKSLTGQFIPNDLFMDEKHNFVILTGPNMSGKSTYLRQIALISLLAQIGSYVPATSVNLPVLDRIFTRIGARDDLTSGKSTFLVEMSETATILNNATDESLVILDEVGRGTSTYDGISIAWVVSEYLYNTIQSYSVFATHYNELTELANVYEGMSNMCVKVLEEDNEVVFLHKVGEGISSRSYGIEVAKIAGLPENVVNRAYDVLETITTEKNLDEKVRVLGLQQMENIKKKTRKTKIDKKKNQQIRMF